MHVCVCMFARVWAEHACGGSGLMFLLIHRGRLSQSNPECTDMANLAGQLALGIPCLWLMGVELRAGCHAIWHLYGLWGVLSSGPHDCVVSALSTEQ